MNMPDAAATCSRCFEHLNFHVNLKEQMKSCMDI